MSRPRYIYIWVEAIELSISGEKHIEDSCKHVNQNWSNKLQHPWQYLPVASVKSLMPPPTVNGTKTFSDAYLNTYKTWQVNNK